MYFEHPVENVYINKIQVLILRSKLIQISPSFNE